MATPLNDRVFRFHQDRDGHQHFNFHQRVWLDAAVPMAFTPGSWRPLMTLALNMLVLATEPERRQTSALQPSRRARGLARQFAEECLRTAPAMGWVIPCEVVRSWLTAHPPAARSPSA